MSHDMLLKEEEIRGEDLLRLEKPGETVEHAMFVGGKLYLKSESQIVVANEGVVPFPKGLLLKSNLVYSSHPSIGGLKCLGELEGVTQEVNVLTKQVTPDPNATGIGFCRGDAVAKVYPDQVDYRLPNKGWLAKKPTSRLSNGFHNAAFGHNDLFQDGV